MRATLGALPWIASWPLLECGARGARSVCVGLYVAAQAQFTALEMHKTSEKNGVLIYVAPRVQKFAVIGDKGVHERCGQEFWEIVASEMTVHFKK